MAKNLQSELIAEVRRIASELGHAPTRDEFRRHSKIGEKAYRSEFGGFTPLLTAAGLKTYADKQDKNAAYILKPEQLKYDQTPKHPIAGIGSEKFLVLGDTHFPFVNVAALTAVYQFIEHNPDITHVIQVGDLYDQFSWSKFPRSQLVMKPDVEMELGRKMAEEMWLTIRRMLPKVQCFQILGNHDLRAIKRVVELAPELEVFMEFHKWFRFDGVQTVFDSREWLELSGISFTHGHFSRLGQHSERYQRRVVCGHTHRGGVWFAQAKSQEILWELNAGYLGDEHSRPLGYSPVKQHNWTLGFGVVDQYGPRFIPL